MLHEKYRPATWGEVVGQDRAVQRLRQLGARAGFGGRAIWISGPSGTGKTTLARIVAAEVADELSTRELDASALTVAQLRDVEDGLHIRGWGDKAGRAVIVNEAHGLRKDVIRQLLVSLERIPPHVVWLFTTTSAAQEGLFEDCIDAGPLLSRCAVVKLPDMDTLAGRETAKAFARRAREIAVHEGIDGLPADRYESAAAACQGNMRALLQRVELGDI